MSDDPTELDVMRSEALQSAKSILAARRRAERRLVESKEALRASEARFRSVFEGSLQGILIQQDNRIVYANTALARLFGYADSADMIGLNPLTDLVQAEKEEFAEFRQRTASVYNGEKVEPHPGWRARHREGKLVWISSSAQISEWQGRPAVTSFYFDITETKNAELALREREAIYRSALGAGRMAAWETDLVAGTRTWTAEGMELFGLSLPDGRGQVGGDADEYALAIHPDDRHLIAEYYEQADRADSFSAEYRIVRSDGTVLWLSGRGQVLSRTSDGKAHRLISIMTDISERKTAELHIGFLVRELTHRAKNMITVIQSIAHQTARTAGTLEEFKTRFALRLQGLAASHDVLVREGWRGASLRDIVRQQLRPFVENESQRVEISGTDVTVTAQTAEAIGLSMHELATNAVKHGALSVPTGTIRISWEFNRKDDEPGTLDLSWIEAGGPPVVPPAKTGFGHLLLHQVAAGSLEAEVTMDYAVQGVRWAASIPVSRLKLADRAEC